MPRLPRRRLLLILTLLFSAVAVLPAMAAEPADFTVVLIPDTQNYSEKFPDTYIAQMKWIGDVAEQRNMKFAIHLGDIVQTPEKDNEWQVADRAHRLLDGRIPYSVLPGNHDGKPGKTELYNKYFSPDRFKDAPWYAGNKDGKNDNNYCRFTAGGMKFLVLSLAFDPSKETLQWAADVVAAHADDRVIVATHCYMSPKGRNGTGDRIWEQLIRKHANIHMVVCGHVLGTAHHTSTNDAGATVHEILCDYQGFPHGGDGWLQTLRFVPGEDKIHVEAYSPVLDQHKKEPAHTYTLDYEMSVRETAEAAR
ncbi:MAG: metallophosphoesterase [Planctomycetes bacterium]|nr:metallophosphoesterase [Planctomycetota bacterium]